MSKYYTIKITGGTSPGPYTIYYDQVGQSSYIATIYDSNPSELATNLTLSELQTGSGIIIQVPDSVTTIYLYNQYCSTYETLIPKIITTYYDFCLKTTNNKGVIVYNHFIPSTIINGYPSWVESNDNSIVVSYDGVVWKIEGFSINGGTITSNDSSTSNPPSNWVEIGGGGSYSIDYNLGSCSNTRRSSFPVSINQPTCLCDGSIIFNINLDNPPFSYSIDNGVTYNNSPIFTNLCPGIYVLSVLDSLGETFTKSVTLDNFDMLTTYTLTLNTTTTNPVSNEISLVKSYETNISISPPLPDGTTITFDLIHTNSFYSSPTSGTSVLTTGTILNKNLSAVTYNSVVTGNSQSFNTTPGCQTETIYQSDINEVWNSLTLTNTDTITISTTTRVDKTTTGLCVVGYSNDTYSIVNAKINGCDCCSIIVNT